MFESVFKVSTDVNESFGTCFAAKEDKNGTYFITCGHVVNSCCGKVLVDNKPAEIIDNYYSNGLDIAILFVRDISCEVMKFKKSVEDQGYKVIGYTVFGKDIKKETISNIRIKDGLEIIKKDSLKKIKSIKLYTPETISHGYSGSPIICEKSNEVIGIVNLNAGDEINYGISNDSIRDVFDIKINESILTDYNRNIKNELGDDKSFYITKSLAKSFEKSLSCFSTQNCTWNEPTLYDRKEGDVNIRGKATKVLDFVNSPYSLIINSNQQYGLSSLAKYMINEAWKIENPSFWLYLDINLLKPYKKQILLSINKTLNDLSLNIQDVKCVVLDEVSSSISDVKIIISIINEIFIDIPFVIMLSKTDNIINNIDFDLNKFRHFEQKYLWSLTRNEIRNLVTSYNKNRKYIANDDVVISRLTSDLEVLNVPRTPLNCLTFLKIYEYNFDETPINRTEMISRVLFLLFNVDDVPKYKARPDLKDSEYVLGFFCENIIRNHEFNFTRETFLSDINEFCSDNEIDLDTQVIFDVLYVNNIIIQRANYFCFKFTYWVFYFAAHRMYQDDDFCSFIFEKENYLSYPEIVEYYTGISRNSNKALRIIKSDLQKIRNVVEDKCQIPDDFDVYSEMKWVPSKESIDNVLDVLTTGASDSKLPDEVKDAFADLGYNNTRPMVQTVNKVMEEYSLLRLLRVIHSASKALRNSDYADNKIKHDILNEILFSIELLTKTQILFAPYLCNSSDNRISVEGASFILGYGFEGDFEEKLNALIPLIPTNVVSWFSDDIFSKKMGTLLYKNSKNQSSELIVHILALLIATRRPNDWFEHIKEYIGSLDKNSFYLSSIFRELKEQYKYSFMQDKDITNTADMIKLVTARNRGVKKLNQREINKISNSILPERVE